MRVTVLPGDGIGPEVVDAAIPVLDILGIPVDLQWERIGWECWRSEGDPVPRATWTAIENSDAVLLGAITSKPLAEAEAELPPHLIGTARTYVSPVIQLRQRLSLFANVRPIYNIVESAATPFRVAVIRENTEGLYSGLDFAPIPAPLIDFITTQRGSAFADPAQLEDGSVAFRIQTRNGLTRLFRYAFEYARDYGYPSVVLADKPNVLRHSGAYARRIFEQVAAEFATIGASVENADAVALWMVRKPERFGVIVAENMIGDILSDLGAGIMGGLGLAPSANIGAGTAYFEPVHGSAPGYVGTGRANPSAMFLSIALMLRHNGHEAEAAIVEGAVKAAVNSDARTRDLGGSGSTRSIADFVLERCRQGVAS